MIPRIPRLAVHPQGRIGFSLPPRLRRLCKTKMLPIDVVLRRHSRMIRCSMLLQMGSCLNRMVHSLLLGCVIFMGWMFQPTACLWSLMALCILNIGNRMDPCESGWVLVQRRRQHCSQGQWQKGKESEVKKASFVSSNRAFRVGKKTSFNSACPSGECRNKVSSISRPSCVSLVPGRSGLFVNGARLESTLSDDRSSSASGSRVFGASANSCVISAQYKKHDAGGDGVGVE